MEATDLTKQRALFIALIASLVLWNLPFGGLVLYPFKLLATWLHEMSHGVVMMLSGAGFDYMEVYRDTSGLAYAKYGVGNPGNAAIAAAGYMGTPLFGALFLVVGQTPLGARISLSAIAAAMCVSALLFVSNTFGMVAVYIGAGACAAAAIHGRVAVLLINFIAAQSCINAVLDIRVLFRSNLVVNGKIMGASDAHNMAEASFGSPWMWAAVWLLWSCALFFVALRMVYLRQRAALPAPGGATLPAELAK